MSANSAINKSTSRRKSLVPLNDKQQRIMEFILNKDPDENLTAVAKRAGIAQRTIYKYLEDENFYAHYRKIVGGELSTSRHKMAKALIKGGLTPGNGQAAMQKLFWQLTGDFKESLEISGPDGGPVEIQASTIPVESLSFHVKRLILFELNGGQLNMEVVEMLMRDIDSKEINGNGNVVTGQMKVIETTATHQTDTE